jgi:hypothetical protein
MGLVRLAVVAAVALVAAAPAGAGAHRLARPTLESTPFPTFPIHDRVIDNPRSLAVRVADDSWWGGPITDSKGETFNFFVSRAYPVDEAARAAWANLLGWAVHGKEISKLTVYQAPLPSVQRACASQDAYACYFPRANTIYFPGDQVINLSEVLLHEYGHHIANNRRNDPWPAVDYGGKRWASFVNVCQLARNGQMKPGDEGPFYLLNPGEGWADSYRLLNVRRAKESRSEWYSSWGEPLPRQWTMFSDGAPTLNALEQDVIHWSGPTVTRWTGRTPRKAGVFSAVPGGRVATKRVYTPLDGLLEVTLVKAPPGSSTVGGALGQRLSARRSVTMQVCGESAMNVEVTTLVPGGRFRVTISKP